MSKGKVDFLLEIMKSRTTTRQQQEAGQDEPIVQPFCADCGVSGYEAEVREQPPASPHRHPVYKFDYYGNRISEQDQLMLLQHQMQQQQISQPRVEDYSEFLEEPPKASPSNEIVEDRGCIAEFGHCLQLSLCCASDPNSIGEVIDMSTGATVQEQKMHQEINDELQALRQSTVNAKTSKAMLEFELRSELIDVQRQKVEMEEMYRREISREHTERVVLQAKLQSKLLTMMEERMRVEVQLDRLDTAQEGLPSKENSIVPIPTAMCTPVNYSATNDNSSPLSAPGQLAMSPKPADPPMHRMDPAPVTSSTVTTLPSKAPPSRPSTSNAPFGLSIVVENSKDGGSVTSPTGELASPTANRSFSPTNAARISQKPLPVATPVGATRRFESSE